MSTPTDKKQPRRDGNPWADYAQRLATARAEILALHRDAQALAQYAPMANGAKLARSLLARRQADAASTVSTELQRWELMCRNESARLEIRGRA